MPDCTKLGGEFCHNQRDCEVFGCYRWNAWPKCAIPACENKSCRALRSKFCWPHTPGDALTAQQNLLETEIRGRQDVRAL
jgi:hypothetical protein